MAKKLSNPAPGDSTVQARKAFVGSIRFLGWCTGGNSDKIWGHLVIDAGNVPVTFWGARKGPWTFKRFGTYAGSTGSVFAKQQEKENEGYDQTRLETLGIENELYEAYVRAILVGKFHGE